jgi:hypothetical protein
VSEQNSATYIAAARELALKVAEQADRTGSYP